MEGVGVALILGAFDQAALIEEVAEAATDDLRIFPVRQAHKAQEQEYLVCGDTGVALDEVQYLKIARRGVDLRAYCGALEPVAG